MGVASGPAIFSGEVGNYVSEMVKEQYNIQLQGGEM